jgi:hypothetical protein
MRVEFVLELKLDHSRIQNLGAEVRICETLFGSGTLNLDLPFVVHIKMVATPEKGWLSLNEDEKEAVRSTIKPLQ